MFDAVWKNAVDRDEGRRRCRRPSWCGWRQSPRRSCCGIILFIFRWSNRRTHTLLPKRWRATFFRATLYHMGPSSPFPTRLSLSCSKNNVLLPPPTEPQERRGPWFPVQRNSFLARRRDRCTLLKRVGLGGRPPLQTEYQTKCKSPPTSPLLRRGLTVDRIPPPPPPPPFHGTLYEWGTDDCTSSINEFIFPMLPMQTCLRTSNIEKVRCYQATFWITTTTTTTKPKFVVVHLHRAADDVAMYESSKYLFPTGYLEAIPRT